MTNRPLRLAMLAIAFSLLAACASVPESADPVEARYQAEYDAGAEAFLAGEVSTAAELWAPWADKGRPDAQFGMGLVSEVRGDGAAEGVDEALDWYYRAGVQGHSPANVRRGELLMERGETGAAIDAYVHAAACGDRKAMLVLNDLDVGYHVGYRRHSRCRGSAGTQVPASWDGRRGVYGPGWDGIHRNPTPPSTHSIRVRSSAER